MWNNWASRIKIKIKIKIKKKGAEVLYLVYSFSRFAMVLAAMSPLGLSAGAFLR